MNSNIHMILDSVSCVQETEFLNDERVHLVRLIMRMNNDEWLDGDISLEDTVALINKEGKLPSTSQPALGDLLDLFVGLSKQGKKVMFITVSSGLSGTYQTATMAAAQVMQEIPSADIRVIDSKTGGLLATDAARMVLAKADAGCDDMDELESYAREVLSRSLSLYCVETLEHLRKGGRIGRASALLGGILGIRPILGLDEAGKVIPVDKCRSRKKVLQRIMDLACEHELEKVCVMGALCDEDVKFVAAKMAERCPGVDVEACKLGAVLLTHLGPGILGLFVRKKAK